ncbi:MAG TPA: 50S ribosomal protein L25 [Bacteroidota bacterium]|jgi:large subunit ribosomal protein L25
MSELVLKAQVRETSARAAKHLRAEGKVPGVFYAHGEGNISIEVPGPSLKPLIYTSETHIIDLQLNDGGSKKCILRDVQFDPVSDMPIHFDLQGLREDEALTLEIPVVLTGGTPVGVREGGVLQHIIHKIKVSCLPRHIPEKIAVEVGTLAINDFIHVRDLNVANVTILDNQDSSIVGVMPPTVEKAPEVEVVAEVEGIPAEPEVVGKGKKDDEEDEEKPVKGKESVKGKEKDEK